MVAPKTQCCRIVCFAAWVAMPHALLINLCHSYLFWINGCCVWLCAHIIYWVFVILALFYCRYGFQTSRHTSSENEKKKIKALTINKKFKIWQTPILGLAQVPAMLSLVDSTCNFLHYHRMDHINFKRIILFYFITERLAFMNHCII